MLAPASFCGRGAFSCQRAGQLLVRCTAGYGRHALHPCALGRNVTAVMPVASASDSKNGGAVASHRNTPGVTVKSVEYIISSVNVEGCPPAEEDRAEFALVGRSNVGKSSLINMLTNRRDLAHTSKTPGKTRTINHFLVNKSWYLVDLPGYGYAKVSKSDRETFLSFVKEYFLKRETLANVFVLVDSSIEPQTIDLDCIDWLGEHQIPFTIVFTKADKRKKLKKGRASGRKANVSVARD
eukprot:scaffold412_cov388-Prasinococcus_capsulatus_cf.AAC.14